MVPLRRILFLVFSLYPSRYRKSNGARKSLLIRGGLRSYRDTFSSSGSDFLSEPSSEFDFTNFRPVSRVNRTEINHVEITKPPAKGGEYPELRGLQQFRGPIRLDDKFLRQGYIRDYSDDEDAVNRKDDIEVIEDYKEDDNHWAHQGAENDDQLFKSMKHPALLTQDRIWFESPRMQMYEIVNGTWIELAIGTLRLHSTVHWEYDESETKVNLKTTRWLAFVIKSENTTNSKKMYFSARLSPDTIRYDPVPVKTSVRINVFDVVKDRFRFLAFRQLKRNSTHTQLKDIKFTESQGYHDASPLKTALQLVETIPKVVKFVKQIPKLNKEGKFPAGIYRGKYWHLWRYIEGEWRDWNIGTVDIFEQSGKKVLRFLAIGTYRELMSMLLGKKTFYVEEPIHNGIMISGPAVGRDLNMTRWTLVLRKDGKPDVDLTTEDLNPSTFDSWLSVRDKTKPWHFNKESREVSLGPLAAPSFRTALKNHVTDYNEIPLEKQQLQEVMILIHAMGRTGSRAFPNISALVSKKVLSSKERKLALYHRSPPHFDGQFIEGESSSTNKDSDAALQEQIENSEKVIYADYGGRPPGETSASSDENEPKKLLEPRGDLVPD